MYLWEIMVPTVRNDGAPIRTRQHREWDRRVRAVAGGLTVLKPARGQWVHQGKLYAERMIPVRIACTREEIERIIDITLDFYQQIEVMAYRVSDEVIIRGRTSEK